MNDNQDNVISLENEIDTPVRSHVDFDMRVVLGTAHKRFVIPASAKIDYVISEVGILSIIAEWSSLCDFEILEGLGSNQIHLIPADRLSLISPALTLLESIGVIEFDGRKYHLMIGNEDREYCFTVILTPKWRDGGFVFEQTVKLPPMDNFIAGHAMPLCKDGESVTNASFIVYLNFDNDNCTESAVVAVQPGPAVGCADVAILKEGEKVRAMTHAQLTEIVASFSDQDYL